ncbi:MAG: RdgB/HAM1 family non-canonical purine NTP pyrophosphatase, partial [Phycisphaerae bacterium]|nr:RdgB/HAM1 family non-canonical purine NTP pyrophosphatase [Phycisphaerae bacterium]
MKILVATTNPGKLKELSEIKGSDPFICQWLSLADFPDIKEVQEDGKTFADNARKKALGYAEQTGFWTIADDSGLMVDALDGAPGVKSARFSCLAPTPVVGVAGPRQLWSGPSPANNRTLLDHKNMQKVLDLLKNVPPEKRTARFVCSLCLASPDKILLETEGKLEGIITDKPAGTDGFGYDPIFFVPSLNKTVAQIKLDDKNKISHRGRAVKKLKPL